MLYYSVPKISEKQAIVEGSHFLENNQIRLIRRESNAGETVTIHGKAVDCFQFVNRVSVKYSIRDNTILSCSCNCHRGNDLCCHAAALLLSVGEQIQVASECDALYPDLKIFPDDHPMIKKEIIDDENSNDEITGDDNSNDEITGNEKNSDKITGDEIAGNKTIREIKQWSEEKFVAPGIRVRIGERTNDGAPVEWNPNDTEAVFHPNIGIIGTMGTGKTQFTKSLVYQITQNAGANYGGTVPGILIFDYKGDYNETKQDFIMATGAKVYKPYRLPFNPLSLVEPPTFKPLLPKHTANSFKDTISKIYGNKYKLGPKQQQLLFDCIIKAYEEKGIFSEKPETWVHQAPTVADVYRIYKDMMGDKTPDSLGAVMSKLYEFCLFDTKPVSSKSILELMNKVVVIDLSGYDNDIQNLVVTILLDQIYHHMLSMGSSRTNGRYRELRQIILVDEADNFMSEDFPSLRRILKEGREFGVGTVLSTQSLSHFVSGKDNYSRYILTWVVHAVSDLKKRDIEYIFKLSPNDKEIDTLYSEVKALKKHESVVKIADENPDTILDLAFWKLLSSV